MITAAAPAAPTAATMAAPTTAAVTPRLTLRRRAGGSTGRLRSISVRRSAGASEDVVLSGPSTVTCVSNADGIAPLNRQTTRAR